jgi:type II secretory pathway component PulF
VNQSIGPITLIVLVIPAIALRIAIRVLYGRRPMASTDPMQTLLSMASTMMFVGAALGATAGVWILFVPLPLAVAVIALMVLDRTRRAQHRALLGSLAAAAEQNVPLSESARAYADETLGDTGVRAMALAEAIERGQPLSTAVRTARLRMSAATKLAVRLGESLGLLGPAMRQQINDSQQVDIVLRGLVGEFFYLGLVNFVLMVVISFVMWKIVPVFVRMFEEFGLRLPTMTRMVIDVSEWYYVHGWWMTAPLALVAPCFLLAGFLYYVGWFPRDLPLVWRLFKRYDGALVMRGLALAIRRGMPLPQALRLVADCYPIRIIAGRLRDAAERVSSGMDWRQSLLQTGLITRADAAVLAAAERVGNLDWALEEMSDSALRRQIYWVQAGLQILFPVVLLALGFVVCFFVVGLFLPLISLIQGLS